MSLIRGTMNSSWCVSARRSAFETTFSIAEIGSRWLTPERLSTFLSSRAANAIRSITSCTYFGICAEHNRDIQRQPNRISLNLHVAFLHDVEQSNLNLARQIRQLVNRKNSA